MTAIARAASAAAVLLYLVVQSGPAAAADLASLTLSPDVAVDLGGVAIQAVEVAEDDLLGVVELVAPAAAFDPAADLAAYAVTPDGDLLLAFDRSFSLPDKTVVERGDVVRVGTGAVDSEVVFSARDAGVPRGAMVDAIATLGADLLLSFDVSIDVGGVVADDEDLVLFDGVIASRPFDGSAAGVPAALDLDAAHFDEAGALLLLSFDGSGEIDGIAFDDEDVLGFEIGPDAWQLVYDSSTAFAAWSSADLDALSAVFVAPTVPPTPLATPPPSSTPTFSPAPLASATATPSATPSGAATATPTPRRPGDLDGDGTVDEGDLEILTSAIFSAAPPAAADVNRDSKVTVADVPAWISLSRGVE